MNSFAPKESQGPETTINRLGALQALSEVINQHVDLKTLLDSVIEIVFSELKAQNGSILLLDETGSDHLYIAASRGLANHVLDKPIQLGQGIAGRVAATGKPLLIHGASCHSERTLEESCPISSLCVPLIIQGKVKGVICANLTKGNKCFSYKDLQMLQIMASQTSTAIDNVSLMDGLRANNYAVIRSLAEAVEAKDPYTAGHCEFVSRYSVQIAKAMHIPAREIEEIKIGAILHDVGKIGISEEILSKSTKLTKEEFELMKQHPIQGAKIVGPLHLPKNALHVIKYHHERLDGTGYPYRLNDQEIYLGAKIVMVADTFDAITSNRPYRTCLSIREATEELNRNRGSQFDPDVLDTFLSILPEMFAEKILRPHLCRGLRFEYRRPKTVAIDPEISFKIV